MTVFMCNEYRFDQAFNISGDLTNLVVAYNLFRAKPKGKILYFLFLQMEGRNNHFSMMLCLMWDMWVLQDCLCFQAIIKSRINPLEQNQ